MAQTKEYQRSAAANFHARRASRDDQPRAPPRAPRLSPRSASLSPWLAEGSDQRESCRRTPSPSTRQSLQSLQCNCNVSTIYRFTGPMMRQGGDLRTATLLMVECGPPREGGPKFTASRVPGEAFGPCSSAAGPARRGLSLEVTAGSGRPCMVPEFPLCKKSGKKWAAEAMPPRASCRHRRGRPPPRRPRRGPGPRTSGCARARASAPPQPQSPPKPDAPSSTSTTKPSLGLGTPSSGGGGSAQGGGTRPPRRSRRPATALRPFSPRPRERTARRASSERAARPPAGELRPRL